MPHHTDYAVGFFSLLPRQQHNVQSSSCDAEVLQLEERPRGRNVCILTTWKNLGTGVSLSVMARGSRTLFGEESEEQKQQTFRPWIVLVRL